MGASQKDGDTVEPTAPTPVATPCRKQPEALAESPDEETLRKPSPSDWGMSPGDVECQVPFINDSSAQRPKPGQLQLSPSAISQRMKRVFQPSNRDGSFKVSKEVIAMYRSKSGKQKLHEVFQSCGFDPDPVLGKKLNQTFYLRFGFNMSSYTATISQSESGLDPCRAASSKNASS